MLNVKIKAIEIYRGQNIVSNDFYIEHFKHYGKDIKHFFADVFGRQNRYMIDPEKENGLTMAISSSKKALAAANLAGKDIDMIVFASALPEYTAPPSSIYLHEVIGGKHDCMCFDINANCLGMTLSFSQICNIMCINKKVKRTLLVGSDYVLPLLNPENEYTYGQYGDAACTVILEKVDDDNGLLGTKCYVNSSDCKYVKFPDCGFSKALTSGSGKRYYMDWKPFKIVTNQVAADNIKLLLEENNLSIKDVKMFCLSQFSLSLVKDLRKKIGIDESQSLYIGDEYGYTATTSPFIVLYESIQRGLIKRGDYIIIWTIGAGTQNGAILIKY